MGVTEIEAFLSHIGIQHHCSVSTQRIALNALVYLYKRYMGLDIGGTSSLIEMAQDHSHVLALNPVH